MTVKEIREKTSETLGLELLERRKHMFDLRSQAVTEKLEDPSQLGKTRRDIARMKTILRQRELEEQKGKSPVAPAREPKATRAATPKAVKKTAKKTATNRTKRTKRATKAKAE